MDSLSTARRRLSGRILDVHPEINDLKGICNESTIFTKQIIESTKNACRRECATGATKYQEKPEIGDVLEKKAVAFERPSELSIFTSLSEGELANR